MRLLLLAACLALAGCGYTPPPQTDAARGREALKTVLDAWKRGGTAEELKTSSSVVARDPDWAAGAKLTSYEIDQTDGRAGYDLVLTAKLSLVAPDGRAREKKVDYTVAVASQTVVLRNE